MIRYLIKNILIVSLFASIHLEANKTWDGNGVSPTVYGDGDNWVENAVPNPSDIAIFPNATNVNPTLSTTSPGSSYGVLGLDFSTTSSNYTFTIEDSFRTLNVGVSGIVNSGNQIHIFNVSDTGILNISGPVTSGNFTYNISAGTVNFSDQGSVSNGIFNITNLGSVNFIEQSSCLGGTYNVNATEQVTFSGSSKATAGTFNLLSSLTDGGKLLFNIDGVVGSNVLINCSSASEIVVTSLNNLQFNGVLTGGGGVSQQALLRFDGTGTVKFTSNSSAFLGETRLEAGPTLIFTGALGGDFFGLSGSRIEGSGTFGADVEMQGTIAPKFNGLASTMNVLGDLLFVDGEYEVLIDKNGDNSRINAATATINNSDLNVLIDKLPGLIPTNYLVLSSPTISGPFTTLSSNLTNPLVTIQQLFETSAIYVQLRVPDAIYATNSNQFDVLNALSRIVSPNQDQLDVLNNLTTLSGAEFSSALDQMSGEQYTTLVNISGNAANRFSNRLRMAARSRVHCPDPCKPDFFGWLDAGGGRSKYDGDSYSAGLESRYYSLSGGIQLLNGHGWTLGAAAYYENNDLDFDLNGSADCDIYQGALYAAYNSSCGYIFTDFVFGTNHYKMHRHILFADINRIAESSGKVYNGTLYGELGFTNNFGCISSQQYIAADTGCYYQKSTNERDALSLNLEIDSGKYYASDAIIGSRFLWNLPCSIFVEFDVDYRHRFGTDRFELTTQFVDVDVPVKIKGFKLGRDAIEGTLSLVWNVGSNFQLYLRGYGEAWSNYKDYNGTAGLIYHW